MKLFRRTRRIVTATIHDFYDRLEPPAVMARESLRELEEAIAAARHATARSIAAERTLSERHDEHLRKVATWSAHARDAVRAGEEPLARRALGRTFELNRLVAQYAQRLAEIRQTNERLRGQLDAMNRRHGQARDRLVVDAARLAAATALREVQACGSAQGWDDGLASLERSALEAEAHAELLACDAVIDEGSLDAEAEFIESELARLRADTMESQANHPQV